MNRHTQRPSARMATIGFVLVVSATVLQAAGATPALETALAIEPSSTWAGILRVHLDVENLHRAGDMLEGTYQIKVPLSPKHNDTGRILLHAPVSWHELGAAFATLTGSAVSSTGEVNEVVARMKPNGVVRIRIVTPRRTLRFTSRYVSR